MMEVRFLKGKNILIISPEPYDHIPVSKHHYSRVLASLGNKVFFLNPPRSHDSIVEDIHREGLFVIDYKTVSGINRLPGFLRNVINRFVIRKIVQHVGKLDVVWSFDPFRFQNLRLFKAAIHVYHVVDAHRAPLEQEIAASADIIFSTAEQLLKRFAHLNKISIKINHGLAPHFINNLPAAPPHDGRIKVGYVGNLDSATIDHKILLTIIGNHPDVLFYFIGPYRETSPFYQQLKQHSNCIFSGKIPSVELPEYLSQVDLFLTVYKDNDLDINANRHKTLEYLAMGKPTIINYTDEYNGNDLVVMSRSNQELPGLFAKVLNNLEQYSTPELQARRIAFAHANSYARHIQTIDRIFTNFLHDHAAHNP